MILTQNTALAGCSDRLFGRRDVGKSGQPFLSLWQHPAEGLWSREAHRFNSSSASLTGHGQVPQRTPKPLKNTHPVADGQEEISHKTKKNDPCMLKVSKEKLCQNNLLDQEEFLPIHRLSVGQSIYGKPFATATGFPE